MLLPGATGFSRLQSDQTVRGMVTAPAKKVTRRPLLVRNVTGPKSHHMPCTLPRCRLLSPYSRSELRPSQLSVWPAWSARWWCRQRGAEFPERSPSRLLFPRCVCTCGAHCRSLLERQITSRPISTCPSCLSIYSRSPWPPRRPSPERQALNGRRRAAAAVLHQREAPPASCGARRVDAAAVSQRRAPACGATCCPPDQRRPPSPQ